ncbi:MAG: hypothetical protein R3D34_10295 [Nitratireductor sp.]
MQQIDLNIALSAIPDGLRAPLLSEFEEGLTEYRCGDWEIVGIKAGKFCEIAYSICRGHAIGEFDKIPSKPPSMFHDCQKLEQYNKTRGRSLCIQVPRVLIGLYELRNNRAIGHVSGDINPNHMDAEFYLRGMKWIMAEFVRFFSKLHEEQSRKLVEAVTARTFQVVWQNGDVRRILTPTHTASEKVLILCYGENKPLTVAQIANWIDYKNVSRFRNNVLKPLHKLAFLHFDEKEAIVQILPPGQRRVEELGLMEQIEVG